MNLAEVWSHLEEDYRSNPGTGRIQRRIIPGHRRDFFLGLELPSRNRMLILRISPASIAGQTSVPKSHGVKVRMRDRDTQPPTAEVELVLTDSQHRDIFDLLIEDLVGAAEQPDDEKTSVSRFLARLSDWQRLLMRLAPGVLSKEKQQGLWGELWTLRDVAGPAVGITTATQAWQGPFGADQDFQLPGAALEVKTSNAHVFQHLTITSERQLDVPPDISLALIALSLNVRPGHGETLPEMVHTIRSVATDTGCLQLLEERLVLIGYRDEDADSYTDIGYTIRSRVQFGVRSGFPRITSRDLSPGISEVSYSIAVTACAQFEMNDTELGKMLKEGS